VQADALSMAVQLKGWSMTLRTLTIKSLVFAIETLKRAYVGLRSLCWIMMGKFRKSITFSTKQGVFTVLLTDELSRSLYCHGQWELDLMSDTLAFLRSIQRCPPKGEGTIVDIGANNGVITIGALHTGELERAIAVEPDPQNFSLLLRNVDQNGLRDRVVCLPYAVSDQKGELLFELSHTNLGDHRVRTTPDLANQGPELDHESERRVIVVKADRLDTLLSTLPATMTRGISVIWVDVQGYEGHVFMGARDLLSKGIPVNCEIWPYGIRRVGMSQEQFCGIARSLWSYYCVMRRGKFVRYPMDMLDILFDELGYDYDSAANVIFI